MSFFNIDYDALATSAKNEVVRYGKPLLDGVVILGGSLLIMTGFVTSCNYLRDRPSSTPAAHQVQQTEAAQPRNIRIEDLDIEAKILTEINTYRMSPDGSTTLESRTVNDGTGQ